MPPSIAIRLKFLRFWPFDIVLRQLHLKCVLMWIESRVTATPVHVLFTSLAVCVHSDLPLLSWMAKFSTFFPTTFWSSNGEISPWFSLHAKVCSSLVLIQIDDDFYITFVCILQRKMRKIQFLSAHFINNSELDGHTTNCIVINCQSSDGIRIWGEVHVYRYKKISYHYVSIANK